MDAKLKFADGQNYLINEAKRRFEATCPHFELTKKILYKKPFVMATVSGERQIGKSVYMLITLYDIYRNWDEVFNHIFYDMDEFIDFLVKTKESGLRAPCVALDDAGVYFGATQWHVNRPGVVLMSNVFDTVGIVCKGLILTLPNKGNLIKNIRVSESVIDVKIRLGKNPNDRQAHAYLHNVTPKGQVYPEKLFIDNFNCIIPDAIYDRYAKLRSRYSEDTLSKMKEYLQGEKMGVFQKGTKKYTAIDIEDDDF